MTAVAGKTILENKVMFYVKNPPFDIPGAAVHRIPVKITSKSVDELISVLEGEDIYIYTNQSTQRVEYKTGNRKSIPLTKTPTPAATAVRYKLVGDELEIVLQNYDDSNSFRRAQAEPSLIQGAVDDGKVAGQTISTDSGITVTVRFSSKYQQNKLMPKLREKLREFYGGYVNPTFRGVAATRVSQSSTPALGTAVSNPATSDPVPYL